MVTKTIDAEKISRLGRSLRPIVGMTKIFFLVASTFFAIFLFVGLSYFWGWRSNAGINSAEDALYIVALCSGIISALWVLASFSVRHSKEAFVFFAVFYVGGFLTMSYYLLPKMEMLKFLIETNGAFQAIISLGAFVLLTTMYCIFRALSAILLNSREELILAADTVSKRKNNWGIWVELIGAPATMRYSKSIFAIILFFIGSFLFALAIYPFFAAPFLSFYVAEEVDRYCTSGGILGYGDASVKLCATWFVSANLGNGVGILGFLAFAAAVAILLRWVGMRVSIWALKRKIRKDDRRPVLFFRSFSEDVVSFQKGARSLFFKLIPKFSPALRTLDSLIAQLLSPLGPVIALGKPGQLLTPFGVHKEYLPQDDWQSRVEELISSSRGNVVCLSETEGLRWELSKIFKARGEIRTLFLVAPKDHETVSVSARIEDLVSFAEQNSSISENALREVALIPNLTKLIGFFYDFGQDCCVAIVAEMPTQGAYGVAIKSFLRRGELETI